MNEYRYESGSGVSVSSTTGSSVSSSTGSSVGSSDGSSLGCSEESAGEGELVGLGVGSVHDVSCHNGTTATTRDRMPTIPAITVQKATDRGPSHPREFEEEFAMSPS
ncbi:hypothetical protein FR742_36660 [Nonomuraea sp. C10]|nr:hypothetical protein FR742_36660 [Nonomuraea sp. C10]